LRNERSDREIRNGEVVAQEPLSTTQPSIQDTRKSRKIFLAALDEDRIGLTFAKAVLAFRRPTIA
jgi:hypothetical protein